MAVNEKNTKAEILEEVKRLTAELKAERESKKTISQVQQEKSVEAKKSNAKALIEKNILAPEIMAQYKDLETAIELKKQELAEIEGMEQAIIDIEAAVMAKDVILAKKEAATLEQIEAAEAASQEKLDQLKAEKDAVVAEKEAKIAELNASYAERKAVLEKERAREAEEFKYNLTRSRKLENDAWEDQKAEREAILANRESILADKEANMALKEQEFADLKTKVDEIPELIAAAKAEGETIGEKNAGKTYGFEKNAIKKDAEFQAQIKDAEIASLKAAKESLEAKVASLETKLEAAYANMNELAKTTVTSTGGVNVIATGSEKTK